MLPGFRFLFAAIVLSLSILVFGLGAAALLRAAHEQFASLPSRRAPAEPVFTRQNDAPLPTLALLRFDPPVLEKPSENAPAAVAPAARRQSLAPDAVTPAAQAANAAPAEPEKLAALPEEPVLDRSSKPAAPATETTAPTPADDRRERAAACRRAEEVKVAADRGNAGACQPAAAPVPSRDRYAVPGGQHRNDQNRHAGRARGHHR